MHESSLEAKLPASRHERAARLKVCTRSIGQKGALHQGHMASLDPPPMRISQVIVGASFMLRYAYPEHAQVVWAMAGQRMR